MNRHWVEKGNIEIETGRKKASLGEKASLRKKGSLVGLLYYMRAC
jgi:hypothetical protein